MSLSYRAAGNDDAPFCGALDLQARAQGWIWGQTREEHAAQIAAGGLNYVIADDDTAGPVAYALLAGFQPGATIVELRRVVVATPNRGIGRRFMAALIDQAFHEFGAHRLWLDTFAHTRCLIPSFDGAIFSAEWKEALWDKFFMAAPARQRRSVEQYKIVKRA